MTHPPQRWTGHGPAAPEHRRAAELLRSLPAPRTLTPHQVRRVEERIETALTPNRARLPGRLRWALAAGALVGAPLAFAALAQLARRPPEPTPQPAPVRPVEPAPQPPAPAPDKVRFELDLTRPEPDPTFNERPAVRASTSRGPRKQPAAPVVGGPLPTSSPPAAPSTLEQESQLLGQAITQLRIEKNAAEALSSLDDYRRRFPAGALRNEERLARIDALLSLRREGDALHEIERFEPDDLERLPRGPELRVLRAELLQRAGRCAEAVAGFDEVLGAGVSAKVEERALFGRAACRAARGDAAGAREDLRRYLESFPDGRYAERARALLSE